MKLTPLIFIPYLLLIRRYRQAATATVVFAVTVRSATRSCPGLGQLLGRRAVPQRQPDRVPGTRGNQSLAA